MPAEKVIVPKEVEKHFRKLPRHVQIKVNDALERLIKNPISGTKLGGKLENILKYRVGDYRIIYQFEKKEKLIYILKVEHRRGVYK